MHQLRSSNIRSISVMMMMTPLSLFLFMAMTTLPPIINGLVPPKTPVLSGFEPAAIGSYRELVCDASQPGAGVITYKWFKYSIDKNGLENWESKGPIGTSQKYVFNPVTETKDFHPYDPYPAKEPVSGKYLCNASNSAGARVSEWGDLYVYTQCSLYTVSVSPAKPAIGSTFTLNCHIPNPSGMAVSWLKRTDASSTATEAAVANSKGCHAPDNPRYSWSSCSPPSISSPTKTFNLQVTNAQPADSAYWMCKDISLSCDSTPVTPVVQALPGTPQITVFPSGPVTVGTQLNLKCVASPPGDTYDWYKGSTKVSTSLSYDFQVTKESAGVYKCVARNDVGSVASNNLTLAVHYKPDSIVVTSGKTSSHVGEKDKFTCTVSGGNPTPTEKLYLERSGGTPVEVTQGQNKVMTKEDNQAEYYCEAKVSGYPALDMTSTRKTYNVTFANTKIAFLNKPTAAVQVGQVKKFTCETDESNPVTYIKWYQYIDSSWRDITTGISSSERNGSYGGKIRISEWSVTATKAMNNIAVRCRSAYSLAGHPGFLTTADTYMHVKFNPSKITMIQKPRTSVYEGKSFNIVCETDSANPVADIQFHRKRTGSGTWEQLTSGIASEVGDGEYNGKIRKSTLTMTANRSDTQAVFKCEVKIGSFQVEQTTTVNVYFPPASVTVSFNKKPVKEGDTLTLTCAATGGNPTVYTYMWFYRNKEIPNETSKDYNITNIKYTQSGAYRCQATNYSPDGKADRSLPVDIQYKAKWNPDLPVVFTVASKPNTRMKFVLHVIANPPPTTVTWFYPNMTTLGKAFVAAKVNDTVYTLSKQSVGVHDYGNYTVNVTNDVGISNFNFLLKRTAALNVIITVKRKDNQVTVSWPKLLKEYTKIQIKYCPDEGGSCEYHNVSDPTSLKSSFTVKEGNTYTYSMKIFDGEDLVFVSAPVMVPSSGHPVWAIAGGVGGFIFFLIIIAVVLAVVFVRKKKQAEKEAGILQSNNNGDANRGQVNPGFSDLDAGHNDVTDGLNPYEESMEMTLSPSSIQTVAGGAEYAVVKKGSKKPPVGKAYAEVDFKKKKGGKKGSAPPQPGQAYAEVDFSNKSNGKKGKDKTPVPPANPGGQAYAEVDFTKKTKKGEAPASPAGPGDVYAEVSKPKKPSKPTKPGKPGSDDQAVYANVPHGDEENLYEDVRKEEPTENGYRQPKEAYQVGVDGTLYSQVHISPPKNPDVIRGKETIEEYASVDFSLQAPPLPEPEDPDDPEDPGFMVLIE